VVIYRYRGKRTAEGGTRGVLAGAGCADNHADNRRSQRGPEILAGILQLHPTFKPYSSDLTTMTYLQTVNRLLNGF